MIQDFYDIRYSHFYLNSICIKYRFRFLNNHLILQDGLIMSTMRHKNQKVRVARYLQNKRRL